MNIAFWRKWTKNTFRLFVADTFAMIVFTSIVGMGMEMVVVGLSLMQSLQSRATAILVNSITARPYGIYRDMIFRKFKIKKGNQFQEGFADTFANFSFQLPLYALILLSTNATFYQILKGIGSLAVLMLVTGRPYGLFLTFCRWLLGAKKDYA
ncbi:MAG: L-alanine exporter AlaE [bacterium]|nr:L-alanine exporter AlaE [bacterium]